MVGFDLGFIHMEKPRVDRWLWQARLFRTRGLAAREIRAGHVRVNGRRVKASKPLEQNDLLAIRREGYIQEIVVCNFTTRRGPAKEAASLYQETRATRIARLDADARRKAGTVRAPAPARRPDKRQRRQIRQSLGKSR